MVRSSLFLAFIFSCMVVLGVLAKMREPVFPEEITESKPKSSVAESYTRHELRSQLIETLDRLVTYEHYYHSVNGKFTRILSKTGFVIPNEIRNEYEIRVLEASPFRLIVMAVSESREPQVEELSIDETYKLVANFDLPSPRVEYLKAVASRHMVALEQKRVAPTSEEVGVYRGFFRYDEFRDSYNHRKFVAVGIHEPVLGLQVESTESQRILTGQKDLGGESNTIEDAYLAQKIFKNEMGRYAKDWSELTRITSFAFGNRNDLEKEKTPFVDDALDFKIEQRQPASEDSLVIENIQESGATEPSVKNSSAH